MGIPTLVDESAAGPSRQKWAFDVSTSWEHRGLPPVGITRTEIELASRLFHRRNTIFTVYDRQRRVHVVLSDEDSRSLLGLPPSAAQPNVGQARKASTCGLVLSKARDSVQCLSSLFLFALILLLLAVVPSRSSAYRKLKRRGLKALARRSAFIPARVRERVERVMGAHPSRQKYLDDYEVIKRQVLARGRAGQMERVDFSKIEKYISVGCSWDMNDLEAIYRFKQQFGFAVVTCVYDLVPLVMPDVVPLSVSKLFLPYLCDLLWVSDAVACISQSTKADLEAFIAASGAPQPRVSVWNLGFPPAAVQPMRPRIADRLRGRPFALYVATYGPRKNHEFMHFVWNELVRRGKVAPIPLVLAGRKGWRTENLLERFRLNRNLHPEHLILVEGLADSEIAWLYKKCRFTVFPSLYEGWGLPVSESLAYGKFCIASDNSSLPEAGQGLARHINLLDGRQWLEELERCISDDDYLRAREENIVRRFARRSWAQAAEEFFTIAENATAMKVHGQ